MFCFDTSCHWLLWETRNPTRFWFWATNQVQHFLSSWLKTGYVLIQGRLSHATTSPDLTSKGCLQLKVMILQVGMVGELWPFTQVDLGNANNFPTHAPFVGAGDRPAKPLRKETQVPCCHKTWEDWGTLAQGPTKPCHSGGLRRLKGS